MSATGEYLSEAHESLSRCIALIDIDSPIVRQGAGYWSGLCRGRRFPARGDVSPRELKALLRNITLLRVIEGGRDYEYRIVGDAYVMAHGRSFQGLKWSQTAQFSPGYHAAIKPVCDSVVRTGNPIATRGWIEKGADAGEHVFAKGLPAARRRRARCRPHFGVCRLHRQAHDRRFGAVKPPLSL